mgnify:CR=1 FL=1
MESGAPTHERCEISIRPDSVDVSLKADLSSHGLPRLIGILDLVRAGGRIMDYKTVAQTPGNEQAIHHNEVQLTCYSVPRVDLGLRWRVNWPVFFVQGC